MSIIAVVCSLRREVERVPLFNGIQERAAGRLSDPELLDLVAELAPLARLARTRAAGHSQD